MRLKIMCSILILYPLPGKNCGDMVSCDQNLPFSY